MIIYNLTIKIEKSIAAEYVAWLKEEHIPELMGTNLFSGYRISRLLEQDDSEGPTYVVQYFCDSMAEYDNYITGHAPKMREKIVKKFGNKYFAFRTLMEVEP